MEWLTKLKEWRMAHVIYWDWAEIWWKKVFKWWLHDANEFEKALKVWLLKAEDLNKNPIKDLNLFSNNLSIIIRVEKWNYQKNRYEFHNQTLFPKSWAKEEIINVWNEIQKNWDRLERLNLIEYQRIHEYQWLRIKWWKDKNFFWINDSLETWYIIN
ncbi:MAG: hypothetical protein ACD_4C00012G0003 [uncultured bacterium (gcode 4)]|uniref:Uncharacterized protein n=1 Tax=uncultured bacterium (gcode 4) TaxID=1234023 RepID=K2GAN0_9BACT|nr:MAG: hypothetical protein ACD_4C00012G0003 [uncultured bacterium (gcode 4)]